MLDSFEKPRAKALASAKPVILQNGKELPGCTAQGCEAYAWNNPQRLYQGCWAMAYQSRRSEILEQGIPWKVAAKEIKESREPATSEKRKPVDQIEMRDRKTRNPTKTSPRCLSYFACADGACPHLHSPYRDAGEKRPELRSGTIQHFAAHSRKGV